MCNSLICISILIGLSRANYLLILPIVVCPTFCRIIRGTILYYQFFFVGSCILLTKRLHQCIRLWLSAYQERFWLESCSVLSQHGMVQVSKAKPTAFDFKKLHQLHFELFDILH